MNEIFDDFTGKIVIILFVLLLVLVLCVVYIDCFKEIKPEKNSDKKKRRGFWIGREQQKKEGTITPYTDKSRECVNEEKTDKHQQYLDIPPTSDRRLEQKDTKTVEDEGTKDNVPIEIEDNSPKEAITYQYLREANGGKFIKTFANPDKCFFRTWEDDGVRKFEFCGNVAKALANINAIFDDVCDIEGKRNGAREIENISAGTLNSELIITTKATIRLK